MNAFGEESNGEVDSGRDKYKKKFSDPNSVAKRLKGEWMNYAARAAAEFTIEVVQAM